MWMWFAGKTWKMGRTLKLDMALERSEKQNHKWVSTKMLVAKKKDHKMLTEEKDRKLKELRIYLG
jgi:hypothetical protein